MSSEFDLRLFCPLKKMFYVQPAFHKDRVYQIKSICIYICICKCICISLVNVEAGEESEEGHEFVFVFVFLVVFSFVFEEEQLWRVRNLRRIYSI